MIAGLLLDLDGTLVHSEPVHRLTWQHFFRVWGVDVDEQEYQRTFMGRRATDVLAAVPGPWTGSDLQVISAQMTEHAQGLGREAEAVPGAATLVRRAAWAGVPVAVVTSAGPAWAEQVLGPLLGVRELVTALVTAADVIAGKPSPEGYLRGGALLGVATGECLGIEDSASGVRALLAAGVGHVVGITTTSRADDLRAAGAQRTVTDLADQALTVLVGNQL